MISLTDNNYRVSRVMRYIIGAMAFGFMTLLLPQEQHSDVDFWRWWVMVLSERPFSAIYNDSAVDYLPPYLYVLKTFTWLMGSVENAREHIHQLRIFTLLFDYAAAWLVVKFIKNDQYKLPYFLFIILNISYLYNSYIWGQVDAIPMALVMGSVFLATRNQVLFSVLLLWLAINFKMQAIIFLPLLGLIWLLKMQPINWKKLLLYLSAVCLLQFVLWMPHILAGSVNEIFQVIGRADETYPVLSMNAFNHWHFYFADPMTYPDNSRFIGVTYKSWGLLLFFGSSILALFPLFKLVMRAFRNPQRVVNIDRQTLMVIALAGALIPLLFFYTNTQMHERYSHSAFVFLAMLGALNFNVGPFLLFSVAYFLNMTKVYQFYGFFHYHTLIFDPRFIAALYLILIIWLFILLYRHASKKALNVPT